MHSHERTLLSSLGFADPDKRDSRHDLAIQYLAQPEILASVLGSLNQQEAEREKWIGGLPILLAMPEFHITRGNYTVGFGDLFVQYGFLTEREVSQVRREWISAVTAEAMESRIEEHKRDMQVAWEVEFDRLAAAGALNETKPFMMNRQYPDHGWRKDYEKTTLEPAENHEAHVFAQRAERLRNLVPIINWIAEKKKWVDETTGAPFDGQVRRMLFEVKIKAVGIGDALRQMALYESHIPWSQYSGMGGYPNRLVLATAYEMDQSDVDTLLSKGVRHIRLGKKFEAYCEQRSQSSQRSLSLEI